MREDQTTSGPGWWLAKTRFEELVTACICIEDKFYARLQEDQDTFFKWLLPDNWTAPTRLGDVPAHAFIAIDLAFLASGLLGSDEEIVCPLKARGAASRRVPGWLLDVIGRWYSDGGKGVMKISSYPYLLWADDQPIQFGGGGNFEAIAWFLSMSADLLDEVADGKISTGDIDGHTTSSEAVVSLLEAITVTCYEALNELAENKEKVCYFGEELSDLYMKHKGYSDAVKGELWTSKAAELPHAGNCLHTIGVQSICSAMRVMEDVLGDEDSVGWRATEVGRECREEFGWAKDGYKSKLKGALQGYDKWEPPEPDDAMRIGDSVQLACALLQGHGLYGTSGWLAGARRIADEIHKAGFLEKLAVPIDIELKALLEKRGDLVGARYQRDYLLPLVAKLETEIGYGLLEEGKADEAGVHLERACGVLEGLVVGDDVALDRDTGLVSGPLAHHHESREGVDPSAASLARAHAIVFTGSVQDALAYLVLVLTKKDLVERPTTDDRGAQEGDGHRPSGSYHQMTRSFGDSFRQLVRAAAAENAEEDRLAALKLAPSQEPEGHPLDGPVVRLAAVPLSEAVVDLQALQYLARLFIAYVRADRKEGVRADRGADPLPGDDALDVIDAKALQLVNALAWRREEVFPVMVRAFVLRWHGKEPKDWLKLDILKGVDPRELWKERQWYSEVPSGEDGSTLEPVPTTVRTGSHSEVPKARPAELIDAWFGFLRWVGNGCRRGSR